MKKISLFILIGIVLITCVSFGKSNRSTSIFNFNFSQRINTLDNQLEELKERCFYRVSREKLVNDYKKIQDSYRSIARYINYRYPLINQRIIGNKVSDINNKEIKISKVNGLQIIESLIQADKIDYYEIIDKLSKLKEQIDIIRELFKKRPLESNEIFKVNHSEIKKLINNKEISYLSIASKENVISLLCCVKEDLKLSGAIVTKNHLYKTEQLIIKTIQSVRNLPFQERTNSLCLEEYLRPLDKFLSSLFLNEEYEEAAETLNEINN